MNITQKLVVTFLSVSIIPMIIIGELFFHEVEISLKQTRIAALENTADLKVAMIEAFVSNLRKSAAITQSYWNIKTNLPVVTRYAQDRKTPAYLKAKATLDSQLKPLQKVEGFEDIMLVSPVGKVVYTSEDNHQEPDLDKPLADSRAFEQGKKDIYFSDIIKIKEKHAGFEASFNAEYEMMVTAPLRGFDGSFIGVLVFEIDMKPVNALIQRTTGLGETGETLIGMSKGDHALFLNPLHYDPDAAMQRKAMFGSPNAFPIQEAVRGRSGAKISVDYRGEEVIAAWRHIPDLNWGLVAKIDTEEAFASVEALKNLALMIGSVVLLIMSLIAISIARSFSRPILTLKNGISLIGSGDLDHKVGTDQKDEIGQLSRAFDEMTENLKSTMASRDELEREIKERQRSEALLLRSSEAKVRAIVDNLWDGLITIDETGIVQSFNPAAERIFGYQANEVIGNNVNMLMPEPYKDEHDDYLRNYLKTGESKIIGIGREVTGRRKDGSIFPLDLAITEMKSGINRLFIGTVRDITERRQAEEAIHKTDERLKRHHNAYALLARGEGLRHGDLVASLQLITEESSRALNAGRVSVWLYDQDKDGICCLNLFEKDTRSHSDGLELMASDYPAYFKALQEEDIVAANDAHTDPRTCEFTESYLAPLGIMSMLDVPVRREYKIEGVLCIEHTGRARIWTDDEQQFARSVGDLVALTIAVHERRKAEEEIRRKNMQLAQASRMKSEFLANMSHELRTPLNAIIGFSEVLKDGVMGKMDADQQEYVTDIFNSGQHLLELINDILDLSKIESGKMELDLEKTHIPDLLNNSLSIIKEKAMAHQIQLDLNIGEQVKDCFLDARRFKQIMYNLLSNAVKFTPDGGNVRIDARRIASTDSGDDYLKISVTDTGIGISEEDQKKLFQPFHQIDSKLSRKYEGTGLGLVMIRHLCELHGGTVDVESAEGKGSTFTVSLPYRTQIKTAVGKKNKARSSSKKPVKTRTSESPLVLIIEDDDQAAELMRVQLEGERYRSFRVATAEEALEWLQENSPDLITLDILLPGMDGWDFLARIRENKSTLHIPVVVVSIVADEKKGFSLGASEVLQKPVRKRVLLAAVAGIAPREKGQPMTVLVVDDDPKTVDVMARHLESAHFSVLRAYGGQEGIDLATSELPGLILLDLMMPEVSGFNVVDALKASKETAHIPIIILTAKTITEEDRQRLNGDIMKIVEKSSFNHGSFIVEVDRAMRKAGKTAPEQKEEEE